MNNQNPEDNSTSTSASQVKIAEFISSRREARADKYGQDLRDATRESLAEVVPEVVVLIGKFSDPTSLYGAEDVSIASLQLAYQPSQNIIQSGIFNDGPYDAHRRDGDTVSSIIRNRIFNALSSQEFREAFIAGTLTNQDVEQSLTNGVTEEVERWRLKDDGGITPVPPSSSTP